MKKFLFVIISMVSAVVNATSNFSLYKGVWANDSAEVVITDSICIYYIKSGSTMRATLEIPSKKILRTTVFSSKGSVTFPSDIKPLEISRHSDNSLNICGQILNKVEDIRTVKPYDMPQCMSKLDVGRCLQQWRLGSGYGISGDMIYCEINTNRHMFVYMVNQSMVYIRAAAARNNNHGTLFFQNIRMMKNHNTGEYTMYIEPNNLKRSLDDLEIDNTKFQPNSCTFNPDGGIYWSLISFEPDTILINGCGETYKVERPKLGSNLEWIEYVPYSEKDVFMK
ncbi:MAG: hypothetical protein Q4F85_00455 [Prevotella sp.]|nr:hypothetical protein [Prevotella sp.]